MARESPGIRVEILVSVQYNVGWLNALVVSGEYIKWFQGG